MQLQMLNSLSRAKFDESRVLGCTYTYTPTYIHSMDP